MGDRHAEDLSFLRGVGKRRVHRGDVQADFAADKLEAAIADERAGKQAGLDQNLEAVADAQHQSAGCRELADGGHHR